MTVSPFEIRSIPSIGTYFSARFRNVLELILKICFVETVIAASFTLWTAAILGILMPVNDAIASCTFSSVFQKKQNINARTQVKI